MSWLSRLINAMHPKRLDRDLADEMQDHLDRRAADLRNLGLTPSEAQRRATLHFGNVTNLREQSREQRLWPGIEGAIQDVRYAWRGMLRNPTFTLTAVLSLGFAIGANTAIYAVLDAALLRPLPVPQPERLFTLSATTSGGDDDSDTFSFALYEQLRAAAGDSARLALFGAPNRVEAQASGDEAPYEQVTEQDVSPDSFEVMGVSRAALGQLTSRSEDFYPSPRAVVVLSHEYWSRRFGASASVLGQRFTVDGRTYTILGVAQKGYSGPEPGRFVDIWIPVTLMDPAIFGNPDVRLFHILGRLAQGVQRERAVDSLQATFQNHQRLRAGAIADKPSAIQKHFLEAKLLARSASNGVSGFRRDFSRPLWILLAVAACILLIACANVASLARSTARAAEMALRISLGARRTRLVRQLFTESLLIALLAGLAGWELANIAAPALVAMVSSDVNPVRLDLQTNAEVLLFCAGICGVCALLFGVLPAWQATGSSSPIDAIRHGGAGLTGRLRMGRLFVGVQIAFAFCLIAGGSGFLLSLRNLESAPTGFDPTGVTVLTMTNTTERNRQLTLLQQLQARTNALPQVKSAATAWMPLLSGGRRAQRVALPGKALSEQEETFYRVSPGYFATLRTPCSAGVISHSRITTMSPCRPSSIAHSQSDTSRWKRLPAASSCAMTAFVIGLSALRPIRFLAACVTAPNRSHTCR